MSQQPQNPRIAIIGGGIAGLCLAVGLVKQGRRVRVYEQAPELGEVGAGISLSPNAIKGLRYVGLGDAVEAVADEPRYQLTRHYQTGATLVEIDRGKTREKLGAPYLQMHRADLHDMLKDRLLALDSEAICLGRRLRGLSPLDIGDRGHHRYGLHFADGESQSADVVIGADGLRSIVRELALGQAAPEFSGFVAWRGLLPMEQLKGTELMEGSSVFIAPGRMFVRYPVRHQKIQNFVAFTKTDDWTDEGWSKTGNSADLRTLFADFHDEVQAILNAYSGDEIHKWGLFVREPLPQWVHGHVAVLGDAAHPMLPWFGQGAATAIEDAVVLSRAFAEFESVDESLSRYELARKERATVMHRESASGGDRLMQQDPDELARQPVKTEDTLGLTLYDPATVAL